MALCYAQYMGAKYRPQPILIPVYCIYAHFQQLCQFLQSYIQNDSLIISPLNEASDNRQMIIGSFCFINVVSFKEKAPSVISDSAVIEDDFFRISALKSDAHDVSLSQLSSMTNASEVNQSEEKQPVALAILQV